MNPTPTDLAAARNAEIRRQILDGLREPGIEDAPPSSNTGWTDEFESSELDETIASPLHPSTTKEPS